ncbi:hypothetical protein [Amycolatopsis jiangsuensis]|uniref:Ig-like domain-containing protein n=1 Tax=Amycolatopsis jiangsuensis TaxID=1181879 RepID=A0A840INW3_9PSEU|nr:hypothetical protein [Amycolatopsis jiangsuensis]MBB4684121.1 hypothetical protein [Amycolatopsis jiangsuensis]
MTASDSRRIVHRVTAGAAVTATAALALAGTAFAGQATSGGGADVTPLRVHSAGYPLEVRLSTAAGDGYSSAQQPDSVRDYPTPPNTWSTVTFFSDGEPIIGYAPIDAGTSLTCTAGGSAAEPQVTCEY